MSTEINHHHIKERAHNQKLKIGLSQSIDTNKKRRDNLRMNYLIAIKKKIHLVS